MKELYRKLHEFRITRLRDKDAYTEFYKIQYPRIYRFVQVRVDRSEIAEDITDEVFLQVWRYIYVEEQKVEHLTALLLTVARRTIIDHYRRNAQGQERPIDDLTFISDKGSFLSKIETRADTSVIRRALALIRGEYREVLILRYLDEFDIKEIAAVLGKSTGAVRVLIHRALHAVRSEFKKKGL